MMATKLSRTQHFGIVYGHPEFHYFQNGLYFDAEGVAYEPRDDKAPALILREERNPADIESAKKFLQTILAEGPIPKSAIFKEAEMNNQPWEAVTQARTLLDITEAKGPGGHLRWKLPESLS